jgi:RNA polymerase sigma-70 factor (ECF subfamily)
VGFPTLGRVPPSNGVTEPTRLDRGVNSTTHSRPESEADDVARAVAGDAAAFERLYRMHVPRILALARRMAGADSADELTQDVFVRAWQKLGSFRGESSLATWLHRMAVNVIIERFRTLGTQRDRFLPDGDDALSRMAAPASAARGWDVGLDLESAVDRLPPGARSVFVLHDVEGYKHEEIGTLLGVSIGTSKSQLHRARMTLRGHLTQPVPAHD